ncbi:unnamed protein product, partial [Mesorhabditis belari]|uniref:C2H2-type domain-containing protein n=1 Tax=Mesorhabditis belari TaxID=2138241 RepID=A0AAF3EY51_9BILA
MDLVGLSQALTLPHNPVQPNFAIIRLPRGTNVPAFYALLCQFGFADVKFSSRAEGWQDGVDVETLIQPQSHQSSIQEAQPPREETPPAPSTSTITPLTAPTTLPQVLMQLSNSGCVKKETIQADSQTITPIMPVQTDEDLASTSVEDIVKTVLGLQKAAQHARVSSGRGGVNGYTRCQKCQRLLSTTSGSLISHAISHYPVKRFGCPLCGAQFFKKSMYLDHVKSGHPEDGPVEAIDLRTERGAPGDSGNDAIRSEWRRVATECFPNHAHLFKSKTRSNSID